MPPRASVARCRAATSGSSGRGNGIRSMITQRQRRAGHVDALPQRQGAEQRRRRVLGEPLDQQHRRVVALAQQRRVQPAAQRLGGLLGRAHRGEQPQRAPARRLDQPGDLVQVGRRQAVAAGRGQPLRHVEDAAAGVRERRADVQPATTSGRPGRAPGRPRRRPRRADGGSPHCRASASKLPPSASVAEVSITVERPNSRSRSSPPTHSGAARSTLCRAPSGPCSASHTTSRRLAGSGSSNAPSSRTAVSATSSSAAWAILRPAAPSGSSRRSPPSDCGRLAAASRTADSTPAAACGSASQRPGGRSSSTSARPSPASASRSATAWSTSLPSRRAAAPTMAGGQLGGGDPGDPVDQLVGLVDDHHVVLGQHRAALHARRWPAARGW